MATMRLSPINSWFRSSCVGPGLVIVRCRFGREGAARENLVHDQELDLSAVAEEPVDKGQGSREPVAQPVRLAKTSDGSLGLINEARGHGRTARAGGAPDGVKECVRNSQEKRLTVAQRGAQGLDNRAGPVGGLRRLARRS
jgi:hypothetical protein